MDIKDIRSRLVKIDREQLKKIAVPSIIGLIVLIIAFQWIIGFIGRDRISASGTIEAVETDVATKVPGRVVSFLADEGDTVQMGGIIASLEASELQASLTQAQALEQSAKVRYENAKKSYLRAKALIAKSMISDQDYDYARSNYEAAESEVTRATAARQLAEISYNESSIKAPISGTILTKVVEIGDLLSPYSTVVTMADITKLKIMLYVSESKYGRIKLGDKVNIMVDSFPGKRFPGKVIAISNKAEFTPKNIQTKEDRIAQVFGIKIEISNADMKLKPGMPADAVIYLTR